jgi:hypothetical protein
VHGNADIWRFRSEAILLFVNQDNALDRAETSLQKSARYRMQIKDMKHEEVTAALPQKFTVMGVWSMILFRRGNHISSLQAAIRGAIDVIENKAKIELYHFHSVSLVAWVLLHLLGIDDYRLGARRGVQVLVGDDRNDAIYYLKQVLGFILSMSRTFPVCIPEYQLLSGMLLVIEGRFEKAVKEFGACLITGKQMGANYTIGHAFLQLAHMETVSDSIIKCLYSAVDYFTLCGSSVHLRVCANEIESMGAKMYVSKNVSLALARGKSNRGSLASPIQMARSRTGLVS